jgi:ubiquinone/menaquinone biosynthesis C-methylase UbiE
MGRAASYERPLVPALYDLDVRLTSRLVWGTSVADQARFAADAIDAAGGGRVLEVPVGTGLVTAKALAAATTPGAPVVAVDLSGAVLRRARRRLGDRAVYVRADVAQLPFRESTFHAVHSGNGFHLFPEPEAAAAELARTLRSGGSAAITTWTDQGGRLARAIQRLYARLDVTAPARTAADHAGTFARAGLVEQSSTMGGTLLRWCGHKP